MSDTFITSDEHYGHRFIIEACNRPFASVEEMTEELIARHNKKVPNKQSYLTIHAGDMFWHTMTFPEADAIIRRLHGRHAFLFGNHDELIAQYPSPFAAVFEWVRGKDKENQTHTIYFNKHRLVISHFAQRVWQKSHQGAWHVYGHSHGELPPYGKSFDIGVDCNNFYPWSLEEIEAKMGTLTSAHVIAPEKVWPADPDTSGSWKGPIVAVRDPVSGHFDLPLQTGGQRCMYDARVAQTAERLPCKQEATGATPVSGSKFNLADYFEKLSNREGE